MWRSLCSRLRASLTQGPLNDSSPALSQSVGDHTVPVSPYLLLTSFPHHHDIDAPMDLTKFPSFSQHLQGQFSCWPNMQNVWNINSKLFHSVFFFLPVKKSWQPNQIDDFVSLIFDFCSLFFHNSENSFSIPLSHLWLHLTNTQLLSSVNLPHSRQLSY